VWEWCWDSYDSAWYVNPAATQHNTRGPAGFSGERVLRGGSWFNDASFARNASRTYSTYSPPASAADVLGFRSAITAPTMSGQPVAPARITEMARLPGGAFRFTISNLTPGRINVVAASTNLQQWTPVWTNVPVAAAVAFTNTSPSVAKQFFRTWQVP